jgi:hypothetical protein
LHNAADIANVPVLTGSVPSAEMGPAHRSSDKTHLPDFLPDFADTRAQP